MVINEVLTDFANKNNIIAGACSAEPLEAARVASLFTPFVSKNTEKRTDPNANMNGVKSIIVIGAGYESTGTNLSSLGINEDYHIRIKKLLHGLINEIDMDFKYKMLIDSPALDERALARRAGLGFFGRNGLIISPKFGSRFNIGLLLTDLELTHNRPWQNEISHCPPGCDLCIKSCPTGALNNSGFQVQRCVSYLTQKDALTPEEEKLLHGQLYGCDICQNVCPFNAQIKQAAHIDPREWLEMSDDDFSKKYGHTAMLWRGADMLRRNARIANIGS